MEENFSDIEEAAKKSICKYCLQEVSEKVKVCHHCGKDQRRAVNIIKDIASIATLAMIGIAGAQVLINYGQFQELRAKRIEAAEVLGKAKVVFSNASTISNNAVKKANLIFSNASSISIQAIKKSQAVLLIAERSAKSANLITVNAEKKMNNTVRMVDEKQKELIAKLDRLDPLKQPIRSVSATVEVIVDKKGRRNIHLDDQSCVLAFLGKQGQMFSLSSMDSYLMTSDDGYWKYLGLLRAPETDPIIGKPVVSIKQTNIILIYFKNIKAKEKILAGRVVVIINNSIALNFNVPVQNTDGDENYIIVDNVTPSLSALE